MTIPEAISVAVEHHRSGNLPQAEAIYRQILQADPNQPDALHLLGLVAHQVGRQDVAFELIRKSLQVDPAPAWRYNDLGEVLRAAGQMDQAIQCYRTAIESDPKLPLPHNNMGIALALTGRVSQAIESFQHSIALDPRNASALSNLGNALQEHGRLDEAIECFERALAVDPRMIQAHNNLLMAVNYHEKLDTKHVFEEHLRWARQQAEPYYSEIRPHPNDRTPDRRLRIGYVSADFREHVVGRFIEPILAEHDRQNFEIVCYSSVNHSDDFTQRLRRYADAWRDIMGLPDPQAAEMIRNDRIDILVDLGGHTSNNRLLIFACKPAPLQVTYLGYPNTTGLPTVDYRITDALIDPPGHSEAYHTEQLLRLPHCFIAYRPPEDCPDVSPLPADQSDRLTFVAFNRLDKCTPPVIELWSRILKQIPQSRLLMKCSSFVQDEVRLDVQRQFAQLGIHPDQLDLRGRVNSWREHLELYRAGDIALDTFPYNGTTTTCEALYMGVPVVTLAGKTHVSRVGISLLTSVGLADLVATNPDEYAAIAVRLASCRESLRNLRSSLRPRMQNSPLMDTTALTRSIESEYRTIWTRWCQSPTP